MNKPTRRPTAGLIAALDIGTHKVCCVIGHADSQKPGHVKALSVGYHASNGMKSGQVVDMDLAENAILQAVHTAETASGETLKEIIINISGAHLLSERMVVKLPLKGKEVQSEDLDLLHQKSVEAVSEHGFEQVHVLPITYAVDSVKGIRDPRSMTGDMLSCVFHVVTASPTPFHHLIRCVERCHLRVAGVASSAYASGLATLVQDEKDLGVTVLDIGSSVTDVAIFHEGACIHTETIPLGGFHITSDLAYGLGTSFSHAERIKNLYGSTLVFGSEPEEVISIPMVGTSGESTPAAHISRKDLVQMIRPRIEEIFEHVQKRLKQSGLDGVGGRRYVLTGGTSHLPGIRELATRHFNCQVRLGKPLRVSGFSDSTTAGSLSVAAGLLELALQGPAPSVSEDSHIFARMGLWLKQNF